MRAVRLYPEGLVLEVVARPEPGPGEVLVRVHAAAITRDELTWPTDRLPATPSHELAGLVEASSEEVIALTPFDRDGVAADYAVVPEKLLAPKPAGLSHEQAAALPMPALTAWQGLVVHGGLEAGERVLITGAHGGVGHVAVQLVRALGGVLVDEGEPCDLLFDTAGGKEPFTFRGHANTPGALAFFPDGQRVASADNGGNRDDRYNISQIKIWDVNAAEAPGAHYFVVEPDGQQLASLPELQPEVDSVFALEDFRAAFERSAARGKRGKVVLRVSG